MLNAAMILFLISAPEKVTSVAVTNNGSLTSLLVSWRRAVGDVDLYDVSLLYFGSMIETKTLQPSAQGAAFQGLTPGQMYDITIVTKRGDQKAVAAGSGRTGKILRDIITERWGAFAMLL